MQARIIDNVQPGNKWTFDGDVTDAFDNMLARSIPQYEVMRQACFDLAMRYAKPKTDIVDLGCSRGEAIADLVNHLPSSRFVGVEVSEPMLLAARKRFTDQAHRVRIEPIDLRLQYPSVSASVTLCVLTLQFTPIEYRLQIMQDIYDHTLPGGVLLLVEKVIGGSSRINTDMVDLYYKMKSQNGYSQEQIERKRLSLEGVLVPMTYEWNIELMRLVGFRQVDSFWRWMNFAGWIAIK